MLVQRRQTSTSKRKRHGALRERLSPTRVSLHHAPERVVGAQSKREPTAAENRGARGELRSEHRRVPVQDYDVPSSPSAITSERENK